MEKGIYEKGRYRHIEADRQIDRQVVIESYWT